MRSGAVTLAELVRRGTCDAELAALLWLLAEGGTPLIVSGEVDATARAEVAGAVLGVDPRRPWLLLDADAEVPGPERLAATLRGGVALGISLTAPDLRGVLTRLTFSPGGLSEDAVRRLGVVLVLGQRVSAEGPPALRATAVHYLRPTERDGQGHIQRRPPAVLATWDEDSHAFEHFAWGITPELADRVDRSQADLERRQAGRASFLATLARTGHVSHPEQATSVLELLDGEPPREPAPAREAARPSPLHEGPTDPHLH